jgi:hypothetical protein
MVTFRDGIPLAQLEMGRGTMSDSVNYIPSGSVATGDRPYSLSRD